MGHLAATRCSAVACPANCSARAVDKPTIGRRFARRASGVTGGGYACSARANARYGHIMTVKEARQHLGGISSITFYALVKKGELSLVKIGRRSFVDWEELDDFVRRKRYDASGRMEIAG
jgi:excisionase family DNA binding protein